MIMPFFNLTAVCTATGVVVNRTASLSSVQMGGNMSRKHLFTIGHVAQLHEIQTARLKAGLPGIGAEVAELIARLTEGGVAAAHRQAFKRARDPAAHRSDSAERIRQAKCYWDSGLVDYLG